MEPCYVLSFVETGHGSLCGIWGSCSLILGGNFFVLMDFLPDSRLCNFITFVVLIWWVIPFVFGITPMSGCYYSMMQFSLDLLYGKLYLSVLDFLGYKDLSMGCYLILPISIPVTEFYVSPETSIFVRTLPPFHQRKGTGLHLQFLFFLFFFYFLFLFYHEGHQFSIVCDLSVIFFSGRVTGFYPGIKKKVKNWLLGYLCSLFGLQNSNYRGFFQFYDMLCLIAQVIFVILLKFFSDKKRTTQLRTFFQSLEHLYSVGPRAPWFFGLQKRQKKQNLIFRALSI